jgi:sodium-dependent dicarboxylate transporter 2/3/5
VSGVFRLLGFVLAPVLLVGVLLSPFPSLSPEAHRLAGIMLAVVVLWITEALPLPLTALLGACACVILRVAPAREVFAPSPTP